MDFGKLFMPSNAAASAPAPNVNPAPNSGTPPNPNNSPNNQGLDKNNPGADPNNVTGATNLPNNSNKGPSSPMDEFVDLFKIDPNKQPSKDPLKEKLLNLDPAKLAEAVNKMNFAGGLTPEMIAEAQQNPTKMVDILNRVARNSYVMSFQAVTSLIESAIGQNNSRFETVLGDRFRNFQIDMSTPQHKALQHPAVKPVIQALKQTIAMQNPELSPSEVQKRAEDYFLAMNKSISSIDTENATNSGTNRGVNSPAAEPDWTKYLETGNLPTN